MPTLVAAPHPLSTFDLLAIGTVLVVVMAILGFRRLMRPRRRRYDDDSFDPPTDYRRDSTETGDT